MIEFRKFWKGFLKAPDEVLTKEVRLLVGDPGRDKTFYAEVGQLPKYTSTYLSTTDPKLNATLSVREGDRWIYTGTPMRIYERIQNAWVSLQSESTEVSFFTATLYDMSSSDKKNIFDGSGSSVVVMDTQM